MPIHSHAIPRANTLSPWLLAGLLLVLSGPGMAAGSQAGASAANEAADSKLEAAPSSSALAAAAGEFKAVPNDQTWQALSQAIKTLLSDAKSARVPYSQIEKANRELSDLGLKVVEAGSAELWTFPKIPQAREVFVRWQETKAAAPARRRQPPPTPATVSRVQAMVMPTNILIKEAKVIDVGAPRPAATATTKDKKPATPAPAAASGPAKADGGRFLIVSGADRATNALWIKSFKLGPDGWRENSQPLSGIPPVLLTNATGKPSFSGQDLFLSVRPGGPKAAAAANGNGSTSALPESPSYRLALRLVNGRYALEGKPVPDTPYNSVFQFVQALNQGRLDGAKGWLVDAKLISVAKYAALSNKASTAQTRIINMSGPPPAVYRFRVVTFEKNDLVLDVIKSKAVWAIKAIFIAPADPLIQQIARGLPPAESAAESSVEDELSKPPAGGVSKPSGMTAGPVSKPLR